MPTKAELQRRLDKCRAERDDLERRLAECEGVEPPPPPSGWTLDKQETCDQADPAKTGWPVDADPDGVEHKLTGAPDGGPFWRLHLRDSDTSGQERTTLGRPLSSSWYVYREGDKRRTEFSLRVSPDWDWGYWTMSGGMKYVNGAGSPSSLPGGNDVSGIIQWAFRERSGKKEFQFRSEGSPIIWACPVAADEWYRAIFDVAYSKDAGTIQVTVLNADGSERGKSPTFARPTLKHATETGNPIPSSLMIGPYRDPGMSGDYYMDVSDIRVYKS